MAIALRDSTVATSGDAGTISLGLAKPTGTVDGDLMYVFLQVSRTGLSWDTVPSGWSLVDSETANIGAYLYSKVASSEGSTFTFSTAVPGNTAAVGFCLSVYDNASSSSPTQDVITETIDTSADTTADNTGVTPTFSPGSMLVAFMGGPGASTNFSSYAVADNNPTWNEAEDSGSSFGGENCSAAAAYASGRDLITATGAFSATIGASLATAVYLLSIKPAAAAIVADLLTVDTATPSTTVSAAASITAPVLAVDTATPDTTITETDPEIVNSDKATISPSGVSKNTISPTNTSKNSISPTNVAKS